MAKPKAIRPVTITATTAREIETVRAAAENIGWRIAPNLPIKWIPLVENPMWFAHSRRSN